METARVLRQELKTIGLQYVEDSLGSAKTPRPYGVLIASKWRLEPARIPAKLRMPERFFSRRVSTPVGQIEMSTAYIKPGSSDAELKLNTLEGIYEALARTVEYPRILCGDFNAPQEETSKGEIVTWGQHRDAESREIRIRKKWRGMTGIRYDKAERDILEGLQKYDLSDVYRRFNGYSDQHFSWFLVRKGRRKGRRFDHIFASARFDVKSCRYTHSYREISAKKLSDHSPIEAFLTL